MTTQVLSPNINNSSNFLTKFWAVQRCGTLESPVIFTNRTDFDVYLNALRRHHERQQDERQHHHDDNEVIIVNEEGEEINDRTQQQRQEQQGQQTVDDTIYEEFDNILDAVQYILPQEQPLIIPRKTYATKTTTTTTTTTRMTTTTTSDATERGGSREGGIEGPVATQETTKTTTASTPIAVNTARTEETGTATTTTTTTATATRTVETPNSNQRSNLAYNHLDHQHQHLHNEQQQQRWHQQSTKPPSYFMSPNVSQTPLHRIGATATSTAAAVAPGWRSNTSVAPPIMPPSSQKNQMYNNIIVTKKKKRKSDIGHEDGYTLGVTTREFYSMRKDWRSSLILYEEFVKQFPPGQRPRLSQLPPELKKLYYPTVGWLKKSTKVLRKYYSNERAEMSKRDIIRSKILQQFCIQLGYDPTTWSVRRQAAGTKKGGGKGTASTSSDANDDNDNDNNDVHNDDSTKKRKMAKIDHESDNGQVHDDDSDEENDEEDEEPGEANGKETNHDNNDDDDIAITETTPPA